MRRTFQRVLSDLVLNDERLVLILGDIGVFGFKDLMESAPERAINIGILEQAMTSFASGLASQGKVPILHSIAPFLVERPFEQLKVDFGYQGLSGKFVSVGASFDYSGLGATHHAPADIALLLSIPGFRVFIPTNSSELEVMLRKHIPSPGLDYFRLSNSEFIDERVDVAASLPQLLEPGKIGAGVLVAVGPALQFSVEAAELFGLTLIYVNQITSDSISGLHEMLRSTKATNLIITQPFYAGTLIPHLDLAGMTHRILDIGVPRKFIHSYGAPEEISDSIGLNPAEIIRKIGEFMSQDHETNE